jgi:hypothetical protein
VNILFVLLHPGYLRPYLGTIDELGRRGHTVRVAFSEPARHGADRVLEERLPAGTSLGLAPHRRPDDGWRLVALAERALADVARYTDPRFRNATLLRQRAIVKARGRLGSTAGYDAFSRRALAVVARTLGRVTSARVARISRRVAAALEAGIPSSPELEAFIAETGADVVVASPMVEFGSTQVDYLKSARALGKATIVAVASWDNLTNKGLVRFVPDRAIVWNEVQRTELAELHGIAADRVVATGAQRFDEWFARSPSTTREELERRAGLDPSQPFILYVCSSSFITRNEVPFVERWLTAVREALPDVGVMIRPYPKHTVHWRDADLTRFGNVAVYPLADHEPDAGESRDTFFDSLAHTSAVVGINTSVMLEAAILGKPVLGIVTDEYAGTHVGTIHFHYLLEENGGFLQVARDLDEHVAQLRQALDDPEHRAEVARGFAESFLRPNGLDVSATPLVADAIESASATAAPSSGRVAHALLRPLAAWWTGRARAAARHGEQLVDAPEAS